MALFGSLVKSGIKLGNKLRPHSSASQQQQDQLKHLLDKASDTSFGKYYNFTSLLRDNDPVKAFQGSVPIFTYEKLYERWWHMQRKHPDITWPGKPDFFARTSGTTGTGGKYIPITDEILTSIKEVGRSMLLALSKFEVPTALFESEILMLTSTANLSKDDQGNLEGEISGINVNNFPEWYRLFYRPGKEIASIDSWDERIHRIAKEAPRWNIGAIAGIPSWVLLMLEKVMEVNGAQSIHEVWPNFSIFASGGVAYGTYEDDFKRICSKPITVMDTYLASEGFFAYTARPHTMAMQLATDHGYFFEFIPFDHRGVDEQGNVLDDPQAFTLDQVEKEKEYVLVISSCAGAWRYIVGDTVKFTSLDPFEIKITGRTKFYLNVVGSQLSEEKLDQGILHTSRELGVTVNAYMVAAVQGEDHQYRHQWVIVSDDEIDRSEFTSTLDAHLQHTNRNYGVARNKALKGVEVLPISRATYHRYLERKKKMGGQVKTPKVMSQEKMEALLEALK